MLFLRNATVACYEMQCARKVRPKKLVNYPSTGSISGETPTNMQLREAEIRHAVYTIRKKLSIIAWAELSLNERFQKNTDG